jgi:putative membrane protein
MARSVSVSKGMIAGFVGGLVGAWVMNQFQTLWTQAVEGNASQSSGGKHDGREWQERAEDANATELVAQRLAGAALDRSLTREELSFAAPFVHYAFGALMGAFFGGLVERSNRVAPLTGAAWGTALWAVGDEVAVPMLRLSRPTTEYPADVHLQAFASHLVYGITTEIVQAGLRAVM